MTPEKQFFLNIRLEKMFEYDKFLNSLVLVDFRMNKIQVTAC